MANRQVLFFCAAPYERLIPCRMVSSLLSRKANLVNAVPRSAQSVHFEFAIVKAARRESLGIIKEAEICSEKISTKIKVISTFKHIVKTIKEQIFTILLIIFTVI